MNIPSAALPAARSALEVHRQRQALWAALAIIVVWGANFSVQKAVFNALSPGGFQIGRAHV